VPMAVLLSLLFSVIVYVQLDVINNDGILYLRTAEAFTQGGVPAALTLYDWPFYSILISLIAQLLPISTASAAYGLNALLDVITVATFITIVRTLGGSNLHQWLAALVILTLPSLNHCREFIIRDHGYFAFYLLSLYALLRFSGQASLKNILYWNGAMVISILFRSEGIFFFVFAPLILLFSYNQSLIQRIRAVLSLQSILLILLFSLLLVLIIAPDFLTMHLTRLQNMWTFVQTYQISIQNIYHDKEQIIRGSILNIYSGQMSFLFLVAGLVAYYGYMVLINSQVILVLISLYTFIKNKVFWALEHKVIILTFIVINFGITFLFVLYKFFLTERYLLPMSLTLLLFVPWGILALPQKKWLHTILVLFFIYLLIHGLGSFGASKHYQREAAEWVAMNLPKNAAIYSNSRQIYYYANVPHADWKPFENFPLEETVIYHTPLIGYDYLVVQEPHRQIKPMEQYLSQYHLQPLAIFHNKRGDRMIVYRVIK
jgi:hypothetical protein